ncbi:MAG: Na+/H+ antiporter subunit E [Proteobacteria bacterium]|nr:Na+/H+ antiporter subunit E [Pseudomonadota bacterium]
MVKPLHDSRENAPERRLRPIPFIITFLVMMSMWVIFSGKFDPFHLTLGVISCLIVAYLSSDLLITATTLRKIPLLWGGFLFYFPWLLWQIVLANIHVLKLVFHPDMINRINPQMVHFKSKLKNDMALVTFANSITLTPGTITVSLSLYGDFSVHAIDDASASPLPGDMESKSGRIFGE